MRAFGLLTGDVDLSAAVDDFSTAGTLAYYSYEDERITIRGEKVTPAVRSTLVHELTHVLQDQHFKIGDRMKKLQKADRADGTSRVDDAARHHRGRCRARAGPLPRLADAEEAQGSRCGSQQELAGAQKRLKQVPKVITTLMTSPYTLGADLVKSVAADGGNAKVDKLFRDAAEERDLPARPVPGVAGQGGQGRRAQAEDGEKKFDSGEFGVVTWYLMLAERMPLQAALAASDGWGGDAYVSFKRDGASCARMAYAGDTPQDTKQMYSALRRWSAAAPGSPTKVSRAGDRVRFETCDPGKAAKVGRDASQDAVQLVLIRNAYVMAAMRADVPKKMARCLSGRLVDSFPVARLLDPKFGAGDPAVQMRVQQLAAGCR